MSGNVECFVVLSDPNLDRNKKKPTLSRLLNVLRKNFVKPSLTRHWPFAFADFHPGRFYAYG